MPKDYVFLTGSVDELDESAEGKFRLRLLFVGVIGIAFALLAFTRFVHLQIFQYEQYATQSTDNRINVEPLPPPRGQILDRNGVVLADSRLVLTLTIDPDTTTDEAVVLSRLQELISLEEEHIEEYQDVRSRRRRGSGPVILKRNLTEEETAYIAVNRMHLSGVDVMTEPVRYYPFGELAAHAIGSVRRINAQDEQRLNRVRYAGTSFTGKIGVEKVYEEVLQGYAGSQFVEVNAHGHQIRVVRQDPPRNGKEIKLHLDVDLQRVAWDALGDRRGAVVAIEVRTGGILAIVSKPGYDPNQFIIGMSGSDYSTLQSDRKMPLFNRATNGQYAPGSTIKPAVALAALAHEVTDWERIIYDDGEYQINNRGRVWRDWTWTKNFSGGHGEVDMHRAIYRSSNEYFCTIAHELTIDKMATYLGQVGYGKNLALDLPDAASGMLPSTQWKNDRGLGRWNPGDTINLGIGQGYMLATPLQVATIAATLARRGEFIQPRMIRFSEQRVRALDDAVVELPPLTGLDNEDWRRMHEAMAAVVHRGEQGYGQNGTAWAYIGLDIDYQMAGKSGTAQAVGMAAGEEYDEEEVPEEHRDHAWFMAFAPVVNPTIAVAAIVEHGGGGSAQAGPVVRSVLDQYLLETTQMDEI